MIHALRLPDSPRARRNPYKASAQAGETTFAQYASVRLAAGTIDRIGPRRRTPPAPCLRARREIETAGGAAQRARVPLLRIAFSRSRDAALDAPVEDRLRRIGMGSGRSGVFGSDCELQGLDVKVGAPVSMISDGDFVVLTLE